MPGTAVVSHRNLSDVVMLVMSYAVHQVTLIFTGGVEDDSPAGVGIERVPLDELPGFIFLSSPMLPPLTRTCDSPSCRRAVFMLSNEYNQRMITSACSFSFQL